MSRKPAFQVVSVENGVGRMSVTGEIDVANADRFQAQMEAVLADDAVRLDIDMSEMAFIDSTGLRALVIANRRGPVRIVAVNEFARRMLEITGLDTEFLEDRSRTESVG